MTDRRRSERGLTSSLQFAVIVPALMLATFGLIQAGLWLHARNVAAAAANAAADVARSYADDPASARRTANKIARVGGLTHVRLTIQRHQRYVTVTITARAPVVMDLGLAHITETSSAPLERVTTP
jgi:Flp pilus assembly protein TadG